MRWVTAAAFLGSICLALWGCGGGLSEEEVQDLVRQEVASALFDLKQANGILHKDDMMPLTMATIRIPGTEPSSVPPVVTKEDMVEAHAAEMRCNTGEATFYLEDNEWSVAAALLAHRQDIEWEQKNPMPGGGPAGANAGGGGGAQECAGACVGRRGDGGGGGGGW